MKSLNSSRTLFIGDWSSARAVLLAHRAERTGEFGRVTHVLTAANTSIMHEDDGDVPESLHLLTVFCDDTEQQDLLYNHKLRDAVDFIEKALAIETNVVLVHCHLGVSRSATIVCAYLMKWRSLAYKEALDVVTTAKADCQPNAAFVQQLVAYEIVLGHDTHSAGDLPVYYRCRSCKTPLFAHRHIGRHWRQDMLNKLVNAFRHDESTSTPVEIECSHTHLFETPMSWMSMDEHEGKLACPSCGHKLGQYSWSGAECREPQCRTFVTPWIHVQSKLVDDRRVDSLKHPAFDTLKSVDERAA